MSQNGICLKSAWRAVAPDNVQLRLLHIFRASSPSDTGTFITRIQHSLMLPLKSRTQQKGTFSRALKSHLTIALDIEIAQSDIKLGFNLKYVPILSYSKERVHTHTYPIAAQNGLVQLFVIFKFLKRLGDFKEHYRGIKPCLCLSTYFTF